MNLLVLNAGSSSQKAFLFSIDFPLSENPPMPLWRAKIDATAPGQPSGKLFVTVQTCKQNTYRKPIPLSYSTTERTEALLRLLWEEENTVLDGPSEIHVVGHRVVHGGAEFDSAVLVDSHVEAVIRRYEALAPLHNKANLDGIQVAQRLLGRKCPQVAVFDTAFHRTLPEAAMIYPGPYEWVKRGIRRYGFHGTSFRWTSYRAAQLLKREDDPELRLIHCHLGGGCSIAATVGGKSVDTTMGFTPLDGIAMSTRSGAIDPGILVYLLRQGSDIDEIERILNKESGLKGLAGLPGDTRIILPEMERGSYRAQLAIDVFIHRLCAGIGQMIAALSDIPDALVFTGAIGETEAFVRIAVCKTFAFLGISLDFEKNRVSPMDADVTTAESRVRILVIKSREEWQIARESAELLQVSN